MPQARLHLRLRDGGSRPRRRHPAHRHVLGPPLRNVAEQGPWPRRPIPSGREGSPDGLPPAQCHPRARPDRRPGRLPRSLTGESTRLHREADAPRADRRRRS
jgi:hypothetical protein